MSLPVVAEPHPLRQRHEPLHDSSSAISSSMRVLVIPHLKSELPVLWLTGHSLTYSIEQTVNLVEGEGVYAGFKKEADH